MHLINLKKEKIKALEHFPRHAPIHQANKTKKNILVP